MSSSATAQTAALPLDLSAVQPADIILTTSGTKNSGVIRKGTCGAFSHAILALENGDCIEALPNNGVAIEPLSRSLRSAIYAVHYRHKFIDADHAAWVCHFAKAQKGKAYDYFGAARSGASTGCSITQQTGLGYIVELIHEKAQHRQHNNTFFCSELVASAFEKAGISLLNRPSHTVSPSGLATSNKLNLIKELIV